MAGTSVRILQSWGVASARHASGTTVRLEENSEYIYDVPMGPSIVRWELTSKRRLLQFQAHSDIITCTRMSPDGTLIASSSYSGSVKLWTTQWKHLDTAVAPMESQHHLAWSQDSKKFIIVGNGKDSSVVVYVVVSNSQGRTLKMAWVLRAADSPSSVHPVPSSALCATDSPGNVHPVPAMVLHAAGSPSSTPQESIDSGFEKSEEGAAEKKTEVMNDCDRESESSRSSGRDYKYENGFFMAEINPSGKVFTVKELPYKTTLVQLVSSDGEVVKSEDLMAVIKDRVKRPVNTLFISAFHDGVYAIGVEGGRLVLMDAESLCVRKVFRVGSGFRTCIWDGDHIVVPCDAGKLTWWNRNGEKVAEFSSEMHDYIVHIDWSISGRGLWICGFSCLAYLTVERNDAGAISSVTSVLTVHSHDITTVGVGFDPSGKKVGSGDMVGNVWVTEKGNILPLQKCSVNASVRCLVWMSEETMLVGTLDGKVHLWNVGSPQQPKVSLHLDGSIIHMRYNCLKTLLAVGTSKGVLAVFDVSRFEEEGRTLRSVVKVKAHHPKGGPQDLRFGQLGKQAEIWSLCWSPDSTKLATCSEDQTVKIWDTRTWKCIVTLTGHTLAVTSVDWSRQGKWSLLASCSDDLTIRLVNGETHKLLDVVDTKEIYGWHTLTYLTFYPLKDFPLLLCTTQNGHLVVWSVKDSESTCSLERRWKGKLHLGSVEGLAWQDVEDDSCVATVGADCIINLFKINTGPV